MKTDSLIEIIRREAAESPAGDDYERGCNAGMRRAIAIIRQHEASIEPSKSATSDHANDKDVVEIGSEIPVVDEAHLRLVATEAMTNFVESGFIMKQNSDGSLSEQYITRNDAISMGWQVFYAVNRFLKPYLATREPVSGKQVMGEQHTEPKGDEGKRNECDCLRRPDSEGIPADKTASPTNHQPVGLSPTQAVLKHLKYRRCDDEYYLSREGLAVLKGELLACEIKRESGNEAKLMEMVKYAIERFENEAYICPQCGHEESTNDSDTHIYLKDALSKIEDGK